MLRRKKSSIREPLSDRVLQAITSLFLLLVLVLVAYPVIYVVSCSFSGTTALKTGRVLLWPVDFTFAGYKFVFQYRQVWIGFRNTIIYTILGGIITMFLQIMTAYPLSRRTYQGRSFLMKLFFFTTLFSAGLVPTFLVRTALGLYNTIWAVVLGGALSVSNVVILRTAFSSTVPAELYDAAAIDGADQFQTLLKIALPLIKATTSVLVLYSVVGSWNEYFNAMIYLQNEELYPLQLFLRNILASAQNVDTSKLNNAELVAQVDNGLEQIQFALIVVSTVPLLAMYAVVQKYFKKGVMIGSVKG